jgi:hypothetical protein
MMARTNIRVPPHISWSRDDHDNVLARRASSKLLHDRLLEFIWACIYVVSVWVGGVGCSVVSALSWVDVGFICSIRALVIDKVNLLWGMLCVYVALWERDSCRREPESPSPQAHFPLHTGLPTTTHTHRLLSP